MGTGRAGQHNDDDSDSRFLGVVATATPEATEAGVRILESGGNALDAVVAISFALGVSEPAMSGLGGQTQILIFSPRLGGIAVNGTSMAPLAAPADATGEDLVGHRLATVPTTVKTLDHAWRRLGSGNLAWSALVQPAIDYAEQGFPIGPFRHRVLMRHHAELASSDSTRPLFLAPDGSPPDQGATWIQPALASTLRRIAAGGAEVFYRGDIAAEIARDMVQHGGWIGSEDLAGLADPEELQPLRTAYRDYDVWSLPPPGGGRAVLRALDLFSKLSPGALDPGRPDRAGTLARVLHRVQLERRFRDPAEDASGETTHFTVVDGDGLAASVSASLNTYYGARVAHQGLGFLYNDYMHELEVGNPGLPFAMGPSAIPYSSMSPTILTRHGEVQLALGSPGSERIISAVAQVVQLWAGAGLKLEEAVAFPRIHAGADRGIFAEVLDGAATSIPDLVAEGFELREPGLDVAIGERNAFFGGVHAVGFEDGAWMGAADPRRDGTVGVAIAAA